MTKGSGAWLIGYGLFLFVCGAAGYLLAPTAGSMMLLLGALTGGFAAFFGVLVKNGTGWASKGALVLCVILMMLFLALTMQQWVLTSKGGPNLGPAAAATAMWLGTVAMLWQIKKK